MRKWVIRIAIALAALLAVVTVMGLALPKGHQASRAVIVRGSPDAVFEVITDFARYPDWRPDVERIELVADERGGQIIREVGKNGTIPYRVEVMVVPTRLVMRIADPDLPFGGTWTFELEPADTKTSVTLTEDGEISNPIFRFIARVFFDEYATVDAYLADLQKRMGG